MTALAVPSAIRATGLRKSYGTQVVLDGIDLDVPAGSVFALLGPNGAGKTTIVHILATLLASDGGTVLVGGHDVAKDPNAVRSPIGVTGQVSAVDKQFTGEENLRLIADLRHLRLDLAMTLIGDPRIIFLDEPTTGLDPRSRRVMWQAIRELVAGGVTILLTTQYLEEADRLADRIAILDQGRIVAQGTPAELKRLIPGGHIRLTFPDAAELERAAGVLDVADRDDEALSIVVPGTGGVGSLRTLLDQVDAD